MCHIYLHSVTLAAFRLWADKDINLSGKKEYKGSALDVIEK